MSEKSTEVPEEAMGKYGERLPVFTIALTLFLGMLLAFAGLGEAGCRSRCLNEKFALIRKSHLNQRLEVVERRLEAQDRYIAWLEERAQKVEDRLASFQRCFTQLPITRYGEDLGPSGYIFNLEGPEGLMTFPTTALDVSYAKDPVGAWLWVNPCDPTRITPQSSLLP